MKEGRDGRWELTSVAEDDKNESTCKERLVSERKARSDYGTARTEKLCHRLS
jgi:hypothetical protein